MKYFVLTILIFSLGFESIAAQSSKTTRKRQPSPVRVISCYHPSVIDLVINEVDGDFRTFAVKSTVENENGSTIKYDYFVSAGKIIGEGDNVRWEVGDAPAGTYTITAGVDDGCGFCGQTRTLSVTLK